MEHLIDVYSVDFTSGDSEIEDSSLNETQKARLRDKQKDEYWQSFMNHIAHKDARVSLARLLFIKEGQCWEDFEKSFMAIFNNNKETWRNVKTLYHPVGFIEKAKQHIMSKMAPLSIDSIQSIVVNAVQTLAQEAAITW